jgi:hypothetical protein
MSSDSLAAAAGGLVARDECHLKIETRGPPIFTNNCPPKAKMASSNRKFAFKRETATLASGEEFKAAPVADGKTAMHAILSITLKHTADVLHGVLDAVADHYKIPKNEIMDVVLQHPAYKEITLDPVLSDLGFLREEPVAKETAPSQEKPKAVPKKKFTVIKKVATPPPPEAND